MNSSWSHWVSSGKPPDWSHPYQIALARNQDGRLEVFSVSTDGSLWQIWQTAPNGGWSHWESRGAPDATGIKLIHQGSGRSVVAGSNQDGRLEVCVIALGQLWCIEQTYPNNGWGQWQPLGEPSGFGEIVSLDLVRRNDGRLQLLALSNFGRLASRRQDAPSGNWQDWDTAFPDRDASSSVVGHDNQDGTLQIIVSLSGIPALVTETSSGFGTAGIANADRDPFSIARNPDGRLEAAMIIAGRLVNIRQRVPNQIPSSGGSGWERHDLQSPSPQVTVGNPSLVSSRDGGLAVFAQGSDGGLWMRRQTSPNGDWNDWHSLGAPTDQQDGFLSVAVGQNQDGHLEAFAVHRGELWHTWEMP